MKYLSLLFLMSCAPNTMGNYILDKTEQNEWSDELKNNYLNKFELD